MPGERAPAAPPPSPEDNSASVPEVFEVPEQSPEDQQNRTKDLEILGNSYSVRLAIDRGVGKVISGTHDRVAKSRNLLSTPRNAYLKFRHDAAIAKYSRKEQKANTARAEATNARQMADSSPNRLFKGKWRANRLEKKAQRKEDAANNYKLNKLDPRAGRYNAHTEMMENRTKSAERTKQNQESIHTRKIEMFKDRKTLAKGRKEVRKLRREMINRNANYAEVDAMFNTLSVEQRRKIGEIACRREITRRGSETIKRQQDRLAARQRNNNEALQANLEAVVEKTDSRDKARKNAASAEELHSEFSVEADTLQFRLDAGIDETGTPLTDNDRIIMSDKIEHARTSAEKAAEEIQRFNALTDKLDSEIVSLERIIQSQENRVDSFAQKSEELAKSSAQQTDPESFGAQIEDILREGTGDASSAPAAQPDPSQSVQPTDPDNVIPFPSAPPQDPVTSQPAPSNDQSHTRAA